jgi:hypothetical protein
LDATRHGFRRCAASGKAEGCDAFVSFDQRLAAVANALSKLKVRAP